MSAEPRGPDDTVPTDERTRTTRPHSTLGSTSQASRPPRRLSTDSDSREPPLSYQIERTQLRARIAALEHALETSEDRRQAVIDRYERLLADRDDVNESSPAASTSRSRSLLTRLVQR